MKSQNPEPGGKLLLAASIILLQAVPAFAFELSGPLVPAVPHVQAVPVPRLEQNRQTQMTYWVPIPDWLAGTWQAKKQTVLASYDHAGKTEMTAGPQEIEISRISKIGSQQDRNGCVWHMGAPNTRVIETAQFTEYQKVFSLQLVASTPITVAVKARSEVTRVAKTNNEVLESFLEETHAVYTRLSDGLILSDYHVVDYDRQGNLLHSGRSMCTERRIKPFQVVDADARGDLRMKFQQFLVDTGRIYLLPYLK